MHTPALTVLLVVGGALASGGGIQEATNIKHSFDIASCPGYALYALVETRNGLTAKLNLAGAACNAFGTDVANLTIQSVFTRPTSSKSSTERTSEFVFNYDSSPFAFWITRRAVPHAAPLFDTRIALLPPTPIAPVIAGDNSTALAGFPLVFEDQDLQLASALPLGANIYGLGEVVASSGIRRDVGTDGGVGTIQNDWARSKADPIDQNIRTASSCSSGHSPSFYLFILLPLTPAGANGADILLLTPPPSTTLLIEYRLLGGTLDFYFLSGPTPQTVMEQYAEVIGTPTWQPVWGFGFQLCRWGYPNLAAVKEVVAKMRGANIPLEVMWTDIDLHHAFRDFTTDPVSFPAAEMREFIAELRANNQHCACPDMPIVDAAVPKEVNSTDSYLPYAKGTDLDVFIKNPDRTEYVGQVWPGYTVFPDWFAPNTLRWWTEALGNWSTAGVEFSGIWLDMNETVSFCDGSCGTGIDISNISLPTILPGEPGNLVTEYPEGYNSTLSGTSGNITVNGTLTYGAIAPAALAARGVGAGAQSGVDLNAPPYAIHYGNGRLSLRTLATNATHAGGYAELDVHNLWGLREAEATHKALQAVRPGARPFIINRSAFASAGKWAGHWLGDNFSKWEYMYLSIQGILQHQLFQIPFVGADACGFNDNSDEELCSRWMQLAAFTPFYPNHNVRGAIPQESIVWDSVAAASRTAIAVRYALLPYWVLFIVRQRVNGRHCPVRALFWELPDEPELFVVDRQFLIGRDILVTPVLTPNVSSVDGIFPGRGATIWRDWYTGAALDATVGANTTLPAPLGHISVHVRGGAAPLLHHAPAYTVAEARAGPFALLVSLAADGDAYGAAYLDDGVSSPPGPSTTVTIKARPGRVSIAGKGTFHVAQKLVTVTVLGLATEPREVEVAQVGSVRVRAFAYAAAQQKLVLTGLSVDLNKDTTVSWN
ncbi:glycoside hydrolase family 31 protein [Mycena vulgaris]|nr:glycoside hydrolase family 31 protein [Mycena vulgaris]